MGLFDEVKQNVTVRQAAEIYGLKPNRSGLIRCIFHNDKLPSMKVDRRYYCFGCGCTGDAIDFTAQLFGLGLRDAAMKLADDFGINYSARGRDSPAGRRNVTDGKDVLLGQNADGSVPEEQWEKEYMRCLKAYLDYRILLQDWKEQYRPRTRTEEWDERFIIALRELVIVNYYLDMLLFGESADKEAIVREKGEEIENIERKCKRYFNERGKRFNKENDSHGKSGGLSGNQRDPEYDRKRDSQKFNGELCDRIKKRSIVSR